MGQGLEALEGGGALQRTPPRAAEHEVLEYRETRDEQQLLIDHADPKIACTARRIDAHGFAAHEDLAFVGLLHAGEQAHQG